jgi:hypothetical protein
MDETGSKSFPMTSFGTCDVDHMGSTNMLTYLVS